MCTVNAHIGGTVAEVLVEQNTDVKAGDVLFRLDPRDNEAKVRQAEAQLAQSEAFIAFTKAQIADANAKVDKAQAQEIKAGNRLRARAGTDADESGLQAGVRHRQGGVRYRAREPGFRASRGARHGVRAARRPGAAAEFAGRARKRAAPALLQHHHRPVAGRTSKRNVEQGAYVQPGQALIAVVEPEVWIEANFKETQLAKMRVGQRAEITVDALPGHEFTGTVESFSPASGAQFAMLPADNATGNFTKVVQRVPVRIRFDAEACAASRNGCDPA